MADVMQKTSREISLERAEVLKTRIVPYLEAREEIPLGLDLQDEIRERQENLKAYFKLQKMSGMTGVGKSVTGLMMLRP